MIRLNFPELLSDVASNIRNSCVGASVVSIGLATELSSVADELMTGVAFCGFIEVAADMVDYFVGRDTSSC